MHGLKHTEKHFFYISADSRKLLYQWPGALVFILFSTDQQIQSAFVLVAEALRRKIVGEKSQFKMRSKQSDGNKQSSSVILINKEASRLCLQIMNGWIFGESRLTETLKLISQRCPNLLKVWSLNAESRLTISFHSSDFLESNRGLQVKRGELWKPLINRVPCTCDAALITHSFISISFCSTLTVQLKLLQLNFPLVKPSLNCPLLTPTMDYGITESNDVIRIITVMDFLVFLLLDPAPQKLCFYFQHVPQLNWTWREKVRRCSWREMKIYFSELRSRVASEGSHLNGKFLKQNRRNGESMTCN